MGQGLEPAPERPGVGAGGRMSQRARADVAVEEALDQRRKPARVADRAAAPVALRGAHQPERGEDGGGEEQGRDQCHGRGGEAGHS